MTNIFFLKDSRSNLEANLGNHGGELGEFVNTMKLMGHHVFLSADSMFCDALFGEKLIKLLVSSISDVASILYRRDGRHHRLVAMRNLISNIAERDVHRGKEGVFNLQLDDNGEKRDFTLNTTSAEVILAPPSEFGEGTQYPDILDNVIPDLDYVTPLPQDIMTLLGVEQPTITHKNLTG